MATNHHFNPTDVDTLFRFSGGTYSFELLASLVGRKRLVPLWTIDLEVPGEVFDNAISVNNAIFYNWSPQTHAYVVSVEDRFGATLRDADPSDKSGDP